MRFLKGLQSLFVTFLRNLRKSPSLFSHIVKISTFVEIKSRFFAKSRLFGAVAWRLLATFSQKLTFAKNGQKLSIQGWFLGALLVKIF